MIYQNVNGKYFDTATRKWYRQATLDEFDKLRGFSNDYLNFLR